MKFKPGDKVVYVDDKPNDVGQHPTKLKLGAIYTVDKPGRHT